MIDSDSRDNDSQTAELRKKHRHGRSCLTTEQLAGNAAALVKRAGRVEEFSASKHVASYIAIRGEIDTLSLMQHYPDKAYYLPVLRGQNMVFAPWKPGATLRKKQFGLLEPDGGTDNCIDPHDLDAVLVPLVVFDSQCNRIGQGGGFYDRAFEFLQQRTGVSKPALVGVAHEIQKEPLLHPQVWDVPLDCIVTESSVYRRV